MAQALRKVLINVLVVGGAVSAAGCSSRSSSTFLIPVDPDETLTSFMQAVQANNLERMGQLWGTTGGPAVDDMDPSELNMRLTVIQRYLMHERYEVTSRGATANPNDSMRRYRVRLTRRGCLLDIPFELVRWGGGWLVGNVDVTQAGNPARSCGGRDGTRRR